LNSRILIVSIERKTALLAQFARVGKALGSPSRLRLLDLLIQAERSVEALAAAAGMPVGNTSAQVRALQAAGLVTSRRSGTRVYYRIASDDVAALYRALCELARTHLPDAEAARAAYLHSGDLDEPVSRAELLRRAEAGDVIVIDVRPAEEYAAAHIPGAVSIPLDELPARLDALPQGSEIVAYCRGAYCVLAPDATRLLRAHRHNARYLAEGMLEWCLDGLPVEAGPAAAWT
jgi:rhodanese-related sulfurtransferase/DNA-binding transcriptional ArsR family regulator